MHTKIQIHERKIFRTIVNSFRANVTETVAVFFAPIFAIGREFKKSMDRLETMDLARESDRRKSAG